MKTNHLLAIAAALTLTSVGNAQGIDDYKKMSNNYYAYPVNNDNAPALTAAPAGYEPFHIEHYGRHGSRWHIGGRAYNRPVEILEIAERNDQLTPRGAELLAQLRELQSAARRRDGELSPLGHIQHREIAERMTKNFPEVYSGDGYVNANSSTVIRCILSMDNELQAFKAFNPELQIVSDASESTMYYIANRDTTHVAPGTWARTDEIRGRLVKEYRKKHPDTYDFVDVIVKDRRFANDSLQLSSLQMYLFNIAANAQSLDRSVYPNFAPWDIFTPREVENYWKYKNVEWFLNMGNSQLTENARPLGQWRLLQNLIESTDTALVSPRHGANLRFGHEVILLPFTVLLELGHYGQEINDIEGLENKWRAYEVFPMGGNIQMIFYRPTNGDGPILVKALLNEREVSLPATPVTGPYYNWADLRAYYQSKLDK